MADVNSPSSGGKDCSTALWLGQALCSPYQNDQRLTAGTSRYDGDSTCGKWPTSLCTKGHRLHDIKTLCKACDKIDVTLLKEGGPPITLRDSFFDIPKTSKQCRFCSLIAQYTRGVAGTQYESDFRRILGNMDAVEDGAVTLSLVDGKLNVQLLHPDWWKQFNCDVNGWDLGSFDLLAGKGIYVLNVSPRFTHIDLAGDMKDFINLNGDRASDIPASRKQLLCRLARELGRIFNMPACRLCTTPNTSSGSINNQWYTKDEPPTLPDRVIEILDSPSSDSIMLRLRSTHGKQAGYYIALSHRWGGDLTLKTTRDTLADRLKGFSLDDLPRTFQDVVLVAKAMDIQYVWIDSLCIVQDHREEWLEQSAKMGSIYLDSTVTVAAHSAGQCNEGFLWRSQVPSTLRIAPQKGGPEFLVSLPDIDPGQLRARFINSEISRRAWILQELTLSRRILHFVEGHLFWECEHQSPLPHDLGRETTADMFRNAHNLPNVLTMWLKLVSQYTEYQMTQNGDKLVALAGILDVSMKRIKEPERMNYHCGVFQQDLERSLLWHKAGDLTIYPKRAPSWSWASTDGKLHFLHLELREVPRTLMNVKGLHHQDYLNATINQPCCRLVIEAPVIRMTASLVIEKRKHIKTSPANSPRHIVAIIKDWMNRITFGWCIPDDGRSLSVGAYSPGEPVSLTFLAVSGYEIDGRLEGAWCVMMVPEIGISGVYKRIGMGYIKDMEILTPALQALETVTIG
ncbi:heterokaryon incompatibility protein-domain-containing protein [Ilyonectria robusta]|uniref:heterokaryon incompatibility protein-domain-containing protein n=1 Tax=Ilyonectria robusta TaxID=1079257 RepID=UPI001E8E69FD|nr:heterokaryon incompatibility protein-domain-containing protein [Ilyonectria robusta]KAH8680344.1 heterokaryon incompatibility protein-domain-containing protein [Ilyonectria robusta]